MNKITKLQNYSGFPNNLSPTVVVTTEDPEWENAYKNWIAGKNPTDSIEWKKGVFAIFVDTRL